WVFPRASVAGGSDWMLNVGQIDRVIDQEGNFVRLSNGTWISRNAVSISTRPVQLQNVLSNGSYRVGEFYDVLEWQASAFPGVYSHFDGEVLTVFYGLQSEVPSLTLPNLAETIFERVESRFFGEIPYHAFTIRSDVKFEGQYVEYSDGTFRLYLKKRRHLAEGSQPLQGFTIVLDAGHGGDEPGAIGPMGEEMPEKHLALVNAQDLSERLNALGASVYLTRTGNYTVSVQDRVNLSRRVKPDLFISLHANSVADTTDATSIRGFTVWYRNPGSVPFSQVALDHLYDVNPATNRYKAINQANFFVTRPQWAPHVLFESSFIINIDDFVWLIDRAEQIRYADRAVEAILDYFS
ncbi:MAG: N-acetylmuramoyl-L-alanine amidase, partial [Promicromonosporaceae bacterium]|nr:N-acetylmuramoyl-L-alanine amidase [Promicromonosporaceae bacterium]